MPDRRANWNRRQFVAGLTVAGTAGYFGVSPEGVADRLQREAPGARIIAHFLHPDRDPQDRAILDG